MIQYNVREVILKGLSMQKYDYDVIILGGGPAGYVGAIRASQLGLKCVVVEQDKLGGVCLNLGCIPSKSLIYQSSCFMNLKLCESWGVTVDRTGFDYSKVQKKSRQVADRLSKGIQFLMKKNNIEVIYAKGKVQDPHSVSLSDGRVISSRFILLATGSRPKSLPTFPVDETHILSSNGFLMMDKLPKSILILGAGAIGIEFAHVMNAFGVEVHIAEAMDHILPLEDEDVAEVLAKSFQKRRIKMYTSTFAQTCHIKEDAISIDFKGKDGKEFSLDVEKVLVGVGRTPNTDELGLENVNIQLDRGFIPVRDSYRTSVDSIFAVGDIVATPLLAHVASKEAEIAVECMASGKSESIVDINTIPSAVYCEPQIGSFGMKEKMLQEKNISYEKAVFSYKGVGKSIAIDQSDGFVKILYAPDTKEILGASIVGAEATELIHEILLAKVAKISPEEVARMIHAHPTLSEAVMEGMRQVEGWAIHG
ncbi:MAG TPA: dihydrolipoyl dehydrogenase [Planctomycetota bacterium]|nr:dihydrolipoyl dehydrogenase [Planctomycetota bacterium]